MKWLIIPILFACLMGCASVRENLVKNSAENLENAVTTRKAVGEYMTTWSLNSGTIQCGTEEIIPMSTLKDIQRMDRLVKEANLWSAEDYRKGCFLGIALKLSAKEVQKLVEWAIKLAETF